MLSDTAEPPRPVTLARTIRGVLLLVVALPVATLLGLTLVTTDFRSLGEIMVGASWAWVVAGFALFFAQFPVLALRWLVLLGVPRDPRLSMARMTGLMLVAQVFDLVIPGPAGDLAVSYLIKVRRGLSMARAAAAGACGRLLGVATVVATPMILAHRLTGDLPLAAERTLDSAAAVAAIGILTFTGLALFPRHWQQAVESTTGALPRSWRESAGWLGRSIRALSGFAIEFAGHSREIGATPLRTVAALAMSVLILAINVGSFHLMLLGLGVQLPWSWVAFAFCVQMLSHAVALGIPGSGNVAAPLVTLAVMSGAMGVDEPRVIAALLLSWSPTVLGCVLGLIFAVPHIEEISRIVAERRTPRRESPG